MLTSLHQVTPNWAPPSAPTWAARDVAGTARGRRGAGLPGRSCQGCDRGNRPPGGQLVIFTWDTNDG